MAQNGSDAGSLLGEEAGSSQWDTAKPSPRRLSLKHGACATLFLLVGCAPFALLLSALRTNLPQQASLDAVVVEVAPENHTAKNKSTPTRKHPDMWPSLFCFALMQPQGPELALMRSQFSKRTGIFGCNDQALYCHGGNVTLGKGGSYKTLYIPLVEMKKGNVAIPGQTTNSWLNVKLFTNVFDAMIKDGRFFMYDWVVKVDPDCVFFPDRLMKHLEPFTSHKGPEALYVRNCQYNPYIHFMGAIEVFSTPAMQQFSDNKWKCESQLQWGGWGEDYYMEHCMNHLGIKFVNDYKMLGQSGCEAMPCEDSWRAAFHPYKTTQAWWECWNKSAGGR